MEVDSAELENLPRASVVEALWISYPSITQSCRQKIHVELKCIPKWIVKIRRFVQKHFDTLRRSEKCASSSSRTGLTTRIFNSPNCFTYVRIQLRVNTNEAAQESEVEPNCFT